MSCAPHARTVNRPAMLADTCENTGLRVCVCVRVCTHQAEVCTSCLSSNCARSMSCAPHARTVNRPAMLADTCENTGLRVCVCRGVHVLLVVELRAQHVLRAARAHREQARHAGRHVREHGAARVCVCACVYPPGRGVHVLLVVELRAQHVLRAARAHREQARHAGRHVREHGAARVCVCVRVCTHQAEVCTSCLSSNCARSMSCAPHARTVNRPAMLADTCENTGLRTCVCVRVCTHQAEVCTSCLSSNCARSMSCAPHARTVNRPAMLADTCENTGLRVTPSSLRTPPRYYHNAFPDGLDIETN
ncbi:unnamed protein product [Euphydryas editha]|uniref:Uncharacterized protein n=1 Tax=Euphydryas editha TaxID=104508 RepID=A0AAU9UQL4_EUPED|nr:unnamed protein product [Euphydryas editha]